jgi:hypothetical protein
MDPVVHEEHVPVGGSNVDPPRLYLLVVNGVHSRE